MRKAHETLQSGAVGRVLRSSACGSATSRTAIIDIAWRREPGGGPVLINAIHDIDCLRMLCGDIETVQAATSNAVRNFPVEDTAAAVLRFKSGALGTLTVSDTVSSPWTWEWGSHENPVWPHESQNCYLVAGTHGSLAVPTLE